jgi:hypothetical protein
MTFKKTDRVMFARGFLRATGQFTGWAPFAKGAIIRLDTIAPGFTLAKIRWDDGEISRVNIGNLVLENRLHLEPA